uniref:RING-type domain-containing protein n=1 Tax=Oryza punctata TaxID=4537 RepID=A0A0E0MIC7_ORYPU
MSFPGVSASTYKSPVFIGLVAVMSVAVVLLLHHCVLVTFCDRRRRRRRRRRRHWGASAQQQQHVQQGEDDDDDDDDEAGSVDMMSSSSQAKLVVCPYRKAEQWGEAMCPVCLSDFADGEAVRVLPECMHYFHVDCIGTWLRANTSCPLCRAETTPTPTPTHTPSSGDLHHHLSISVSLEEILNAGDQSDYKAAVAIMLSVSFVVILIRLIHFIINQSDHRAPANGDVTPRPGGGGVSRVPARFPRPRPVGAGNGMAMACQPPPCTSTYRRDDGWMETACPVCLSDFADGEVIRLLPECMHYFHAACIDEWLRTRATCPLCRAAPAGEAAA